MTRGFCYLTLAPNTTELRTAVTSSVSPHETCYKLYIFKKKFVIDVCYMFNKAIPMTIHRNSEQQVDSWQPKPGYHSDTRCTCCYQSPLHVPDDSRSLRGFQLVVLSESLSPHLEWITLKTKYTLTYTDRQNSLLSIDGWRVSQNPLPPVMSFPFPPLEVSLPCSLERDKRMKGNWGASTPIRCGGRRALWEYTTSYWSVRVNGGAVKAGISLYCFDVLQATAETEKL